MDIPSVKRPCQSGHPDESSRRDDTGHPDDAERPIKEEILDWEDGPIMETIEMKENDTKREATNLEDHRPRAIQIHQIRIREWGVDINGTEAVEETWLLALMASRPPPTASTTLERFNNDDNNKYDNIHPILFHRHTYERQSLHGTGSSSRLRRAIALAFAAQEGVGISTEEVISLWHVKDNAMFVKTDVNVSSKVEAMVRSAVKAGE
ncbi:MAG: hypothetical protein Q9212_005399 [Teloschistes hypoglaucus]